jgi:hypothetical protein
MMFLVRSTFWLSIVVAHMPLDQGEALRVVDQAQGTVIAGAVNLAKAKCAQESASCQALLTAAAGAVLAPNVEHAPIAHSAAARTDGKARSLRPSANSLSAADLAAPWRGKPAKS